MTNSPLIRELEQIAQVVEFPTANSFTLGELPEVQVEAVGSDSAAPHPVLIDRLVDAIYWNAYARKLDPASLRQTDSVELNYDPTFVETLKSGEGEDRWDEGWVVERVMPDGSVQARKNDCYRAPVPGEFSFDVPGVRPGPGDRIRIRVQSGSTRIQTGFYFAFSDVIPDQYEEFQSTRFYFNLRADLLPLFNELRHRLNQFRIPFRFKCPTSPEQFERRDSGVLYVPGRFVDLTAACVKEVVDNSEWQLEPDIPLFTRLFAPGIGMAEDPGTMDSFGRLRCEHVARGLWSAAFEFPQAAPADRIRAEFESAGLSLDRPWLNPGSLDWNLPAGLAFPGRASAAKLIEPGSALHAADRIGSGICRDAIWSGDRCNWLGWSAEERSGQWIPIHRALGPTPADPCSGISLYDGSSGVALFLSRLYGETEDRIHRATLIGSVRQITEQLDQLESEKSLAFYAGWTGASWAIAQIGRTLEDESLIRKELTRLERTGIPEPRVPETDMVLGSAGLISSLVDLHTQHHCPTLLEIAVRHGDFLLNSATRGEEGWSWTTLPVPVIRNLTGYAHGVSGVVCALAELARATGENRFSQAVEEGLRYEQSQFSEDQQNWRDYRADAAETGGEAYQFGWCHGAPGIGMARVRLLELGFDTPEIRRDLDAALATTASKLHYANSPGQRDFCICHGLAGNAELPLLASTLPGLASLREQTARVGQFGIDEFQTTGKPWPCNLGGTGETPTLFCGTAGIGYFYLRLSNPESVPSILLLRPQHRTA